jgi:phosphatidate cytidylyltransferase
VSNLTTRILVALVGIPLILLLVFAGGFYFYGFVLAVSVAGLLEFFQLAREKGYAPITGIGVAFAVALTTVFLTDRLRGTLSFVLDRAGISFPAPSVSQSMLIVLLLFVPTILLAELVRGKPNALANAGVTVLGPAYVSLFSGALLGIRELFDAEHFPVFRVFGVSAASPPAGVLSTLDGWGAATVVTIFAAIWVCDSSAYFAGRALGKHKLFERVSPNKTVEGAIAGFVGAVAAFLVSRAFFLPYLTFGEAAVCGMIVGVFGQAGDLVESLFKRDAGVKDSSHLIPGHGGVLDRFDSLVFVSPILYLYLDFIVFAT